MHLAAIEAFIAVCDEGSFRDAALRLHLTQPAISKRVAAVESRLGRRLFDRIGRRVVLTEAGRSFLPHGRRLLTELADAHRALDNLSATVSGRLGLALSHHVALHRMPSILQRFVAEYPEVQLDIEFLGSEDACQAVLQGRVELAVITLPDPPLTELTQQEVWPDPMRILVAPNHPLASRQSLVPVDLADIPALLPESGTYTHAMVARALAHFGVQPRVRLASNYLETLRMLAGVGLGWTALPETMIDEALTPLYLPELQLTRSLGTVHHPARHLSNAARALLTLLAASADGADVTPPPVPDAPPEPADRTRR